MATSLRPLHAAVFAKLSASPVLAGRVYAKVPEPAPYPLVSIGSITEIPDDQHDAQGLDVLLVIHVWAKGSSVGPAYDLMAAVDEALDRVALTVAGFTEVRIRLEQAQAIEDPDPEITHINARFRVHMTKE